MAQPPKEGTHWWAVQTRAHFERTVEEQLLGRAVETFLPKYRTYSRRKDRRQIISLPLFAGYLFVHIDISVLTNRVAVLRTRGVVKFVGGALGPEPIPEVEIENVRRLCSSDRLLEPVARLEVGKQVRVVSGGLAGVRGIVVDIVGKGMKIICNVELLGRAVAAELKADELEPLGTLDQP